MKDETNSISYKEAHRLLHTLWTKAVGTRDYVKQEWREMELIIERCTRR